MQVRRNSLQLASTLLMKGGALFVSYGQRGWHETDPRDLSNEQKAQELDFGEYIFSS